MTTAAALARRRGTMTGARVRALRETHGLTQDQVAELLGYTTNYIAIVERGEDIPVAPRFEKLVRALLLQPTGDLVVSPRKRPPFKTHRKQTHDQ